jgi:hypothetical protein
MEDCEVPYRRYSRPAVSNAAYKFAGHVGFDLCHKYILYMYLYLYFMQVLFQVAGNPEIQIRIQNIFVTLNDATHGALTCAALGAACWVRPVSSHKYQAGVYK